MADLVAQYDAKLAPLIERREQLEATAQRKAWSDSADREWHQAMRLITELTNAWRLALDEAHRRAKPKPPLRVVASKDD